VTSTLFMALSFAAFGGNFNPPISRPSVHLYATYLHGQSMSIKHITVLISASSHLSVLDSKRMG